MNTVKKLAAFCCVLCLILTPAGALAAPQYGAWVIELENIELTVDGEVIAMDPPIRITVGFTDDFADAFLTAEIPDGDEVLGAFMAEETEGGPSRCAWSEGDTCALMRGKDSFHALVMRQLEIDEIPDSLTDAVDMLDAFLSMPKGVEYLLEHLGSIGRLGKNRYDVSLPLGCGQARFELSWHYEKRVKKPFNLSGRTDAQYSAAQGLSGVEGFEEAGQALELALMENESMEDVLIALSLMLP